MADHRTLELFFLIKKRHGLSTKHKAFHCPEGACDRTVCPRWQFLVCLCDASQAPVHGTSLVHGCAVQRASSALPLATIGDGSANSPSPFSRGSDKGEGEGEGRGCTWAPRMLYTCFVC